MADLVKLEERLERLYGQIFDLKASLGTIAKLMEDDIESGKIRCTMVRRALLNDARALTEGNGGK